MIKSMTCVWNWKLLINGIKTILLKCFELFCKVSLPNTVCISKENFNKYLKFMLNMKIPSSTLSSTSRNSNYSN